MRHKKKIVINKKAKHWKDRFPLVEVTWVDICSDSAWQSIDTLNKAQLPNCVTKGHLLTQKNGVTRLFGDYSENKEGEIDEIGNSTIIPNNVIKKIQKLI
jgi:hypothetical protein|tara:strand:- start:1616 stop:1915 length:300 start_codon:yes stop_codon:yes gene_type:complete